MYFLECENIASKHPELREAISRVDEMLSTHSGSSVLRPRDVAEVLNLDEVHVEGIFLQLSETGLLRDEVYYECRVCSNLMDTNDFDTVVKNGDPFECSQCLKKLDIRDVDKVTVFRVNVAKPRERPATEQDRGSGTSASSKSNELPKRILTDPFKYTHLLRYYSNDHALIESLPFKGKRALFLLHFLLDIIPFVQACIRLGLDLKSSSFFFKEYPYPQRESIGKWLKEQGAVVEPRREIESILKQLEGSGSDRIGDVLIVEDGGLILPAIYSSFVHLIPSVVGVVEQTARGIWNDEKIQGSRTAVLSVATSRLKGDFEPPYIAEAVVNNLQRFLPNVALRGKEVALLGFGTIGEKVANWLREKGAIVKIFDTALEKKLKANQAAFETVASPVDAVKDASIVIGASGEEAVTSSVISSLKHSTYLLSVSSEQYEINVEELEKMAKSKREMIGDDDEVIGSDYTLIPDDRVVHLLANGYPINFWGWESMPEEASDLILTLILLSMVELSLGNYRTPGINLDAVNKIADKYKVAEKFQEIHGK